MTNVACGTACQDPAYRRAKGCDGPAVLPPGAGGVFSILCWRCRGESISCALCRGKGRVWFDRCPTSKWEPWLRGALRSLVHYEDGFLPVEGGMEDQAAPWVEALHLARPHRAACAEQAAERESKTKR